MSFTQGYGTVRLTLHADERPETNQEAATMASKNDETLDLGDVGQNGKQTCAGSNRDGTWGLSGSEREGRADSRMVPGFLNWVRGSVLALETKIQTGDKSVGEG